MARTSIPSSNVPAGSGNPEQSRTSQTGATGASGRAAARPAAARRSAALSHEEIAKRARAVWQAKGCPQGQDERIWLEAEAQLKAELGSR